MKIYYSGIAVAISSIFLLSSCGGSLDSSNSQKTPFIVNTKVIGQPEASSFSLEKGIVLTAGSQLSVNADTTGQVGKMFAKEGDTVKKGQVIIQLKDTVSMFDLSLAQASNSLKGANAARNVSIVALDRSIQDAQIGYEQAKRAYDTLQRDIVERRKQAQNDFFNANPNNSGSTASLNIEKLRIDLAKAKDDLRNQESTLGTSFIIYLNDFEKNADQVLYEADKILGMTSNFQYLNDGWETYLGAKGGSAKQDAEKAWTELYSKRAEIRAIKEQNITMTPTNASELISKLSDAHRALRNATVTVGRMLETSVISGGLSQGMVDGWTALFNGLKAASQGSESQFIAWKNNVNSLIKGSDGKSIAEKNIASIELQIQSAERGINTGKQSAEIGYNRTLIGFDDQIRAAELSLKQAENGLSVARKNRDATLAQLSSNVAGANIALSLAARNYDKLTIKAPVDGKITKIRVSVGQNMNMGGIGFDMTSTTPEIVTDVDYKVAFGVKVGDSVTIEVQGQSFTGNIIALSRIANANLLYTTRISIPSAEKFIGNPAKAIFQVKNQDDNTVEGQKNDIFLPLSSVKLISEQEGEIALLSGQTVQYKSIKLGKLSGENIEIITPIPQGTEIILSDVSNFNDQKHTLTRKEKTKDTTHK